MAPRRCPASAKRLSRDNGRRPKTTPDAPRPRFWRTASSWIVRPPCCARIPYNLTMSKPDPRTAPFGSVFCEQMAVATYNDGAWSPFEFKPTGALSLHPATHALHYGSSCFEGFKAYRRADGAVHIFRLDSHIARMRQSARLLVLPEPDVK